MNSLTFGRYNPYRTFVHRIDPRTKLFLTILLMVMIFFQFKLWSTSLILSAFYLVLLIVIMAISKVSFLSLFNSLKGMWFLVLFLFVIYVFIPNSSYTMKAFDINGYNIYWDSLYQSAYIILRLVLMISLTMVLTSSTKPMDLTYALEWYLTPLKIFHFPSHIIAMTISIALRFIPTLLDETDRIMKAQASRGVDFQRGGLFTKLKASITLIVPLMFSSLERSEELSNAMEVRGYDPYGKRTRYRQLKFGICDLISCIVCLLIFGGIIYLFIYDKSQTLDILKILFNVEANF